MLTKLSQPFIHSLICMSIRSQWQLLRNRNKPVQTIYWYLTMHRRAIACTYYCVTHTISRTGGLIHLISGGNLLGSSDEWFYYIIFSRFKVSLLLLMMILWTRLMTDMNLLTCKCQKSMHLSCDFFTSQCIYTPFEFVHCSDEKIEGRVHWFFTFALQQIHIQSLTSN